MYTAFRKPATAPVRKRYRSENNFHIEYYLTLKKIIVWIKCHSCTWSFFTLNWIIVYRTVLELKDYGIKSIFLEIYFYLPMELEESNYVLTICKGLWVGAF